MSILLRKQVQEKAIPPPPPVHIFSFIAKLKSSPNFSSSYLPFHNNDLNYLSSIVDTVFEQHIFTNCLVLLTHRVWITWTNIYRISVNHFEVLHGGTTEGTRHFSHKKCQKCCCQHFLLMSTRISKIHIVTWFWLLYLRNAPVTRNIK